MQDTDDRRAMPGGLHPLVGQALDQGYTVAVIDPAVIRRLARLLHTAPRETAA